MAWRFHGRAQVDANNPRAFGVCDRCGLWYNHRDLVWQYQWIGPQLQNLRILVCTATCLDVPQEQLRTVILPADPYPILNARPEPFAIDEIDFLTTEDGDFLVTQDGDFLVTDPMTSVAPIER